MYILLPYYSRGNLQDAINANLVNRSRMGERKLMVLMRGVCRALKAMHQYKVGESGAGGKGRKEAKKVRAEGVRADAELAGQDPDSLDQEFEDGDVTAAANSSKRRKGRRRTRGEDEEREALMEDEITNQQGLSKGEIKSYAHRDIKPGGLSTSIRLQELAFERFD